MPMPRKTHCRCGKPKNSETTATLISYDGKPKLHYLCKECDRKRSREARYAKMSVEELLDLRSKFYRMASNIDAAIERKLNKVEPFSDNELERCSEYDKVGRDKK